MTWKTGTHLKDVVYKNLKHEAWNFFQISILVIGIYISKI